jgi:hypothetical protein
MPSETLEFIATAQDRASSVITGLENKLKALGGQQSGVLGTVNKGISNIDPSAIVALGGVAALAGGITEVATKVGDMAGEFVNAALQEQGSIARLDQSLKDNVTNWDGNGAAIERTIKFYENTGFAADDLRGSFAQLIQTTHNTETATTGLGLAADIARGHNMDLASASELVAKVYAGNYTRALKGLGLDMTGITTKEQALQLLEKTFAGQAGAWAETEAGKLAILHNQMHDTEVELGNHLLPTTDKMTSAALSLTPALGAAADQLGSFIDAITGAAGLGGKTTPLDVSNLLGDIPSSIRDLIPGMQTAWKQAQDSLNFVHGSDVGAIYAQTVAKQMDNSTPVVTSAVARWGKQAGSQGEKVFQKAGADAIAAYAHAVAGGHASIETAFKSLQQAEKHPLDVMKQIASDEAILTSSALLKGLASSDPDIRAWAEDLQQSVETHLVGLKVFAVSLGKHVSSAINRWGKVPGYAAGGHYAAGMPRIVGEHGPELDVPSTSGYVVPNSALGGGARNITVQIDGETLFRIVDGKLGRALANQSGLDYVRN